MPLGPVEVVTHHVRIATRIAPGRPALWIGLRMAAAMALPLALSPWLPPVVATSASLAGYFITLVDQGGAYRARARGMLLATVGALLALVIGVPVQGTPLAAPVAIVGFTLCALAHHWGPAGASIANPAAVLLALACLRPGPEATLPQALLGTAFGASWAMLLSLIVWPIRVHRPGMSALANAFEELAGLAGAIADAALGHGEPAVLLGRHRRMRDQLEVARRTLVATRRGRGDRERVELLLALVQVCDYAFGRLTAVEEALDATARSDATEATANTLRGYAGILYRLADLVMRERPSPDTLAAVDELLHASAPARTGDRHLDLLLDAATGHLATCRRIIGALAGTDPVPELTTHEDTRGRAPLGDLLRVDSAVFRHAVRVALASTAALAIASAIDLEYGYWILLTVFLLLRPYRSATITRAVQRALGTVAGVAIAAALVALIPQQAALIAITIVFAALGASVLQLNYALFSLFVTPTFLLLVELHTQDFTLGGIRIGYTIIGAALALLTSALLWPRRDRTVVDEHLADAIDAAAEHLASVRRAVASGAPRPVPAISAARRTLGIELNNAELALDRVIAEPAPEQLIEPRLSALAAVRRLGGATNVLGTIRSLLADKDREAIAHHARCVEDRLHALANALRDGAPIDDSPRPCTHLTEGQVTPVLRLSHHLDVLTSALARAR